MPPVETAKPVALGKHVIIRAEVQYGAGQIEARSCLALLQRQMPTASALLGETAKGT